jgi:hypothetical protein
MVSAASFVLCFQHEAKSGEVTTGRE